MCIRDRCQILDDMMNRSQEPENVSDRETIFARIHHRLVRLYNILPVSYTHLDVYKRQTQGLQKIQSSLHTVMLSMDQEIDRLGSMAEELHVAKGHLRNAFLEMNGKDVYKRQQCNCSMVVTDPKGGARRSSLKRTGTSQLNHCLL